MRHETSFFSRPSALTIPKLNSLELLLFLVSIYDCHADIQRREFENARRACFDHRLWGVSTCCGPSLLASCVLILLAHTGRRGGVLTAVSSRTDVFHFAQTSVAILALAALVFL